MDHVEIGGTIRLKSIYDPRGMDHVEIGGTSQSVIYNLSHFYAKYTRSYMKRLLNFGGKYMLLRVLFHLFMTSITGGLWLLGLIIWYILDSKK